MTLQEAIRIYARASRAWFGPYAPARTQERINQLAKAGDLEGARVFEEVKLHIMWLEQREPAAAAAGQPEEGMSGSGARVASNRLRRRRRPH